MRQGANDVGRRQLRARSEKEADAIVSEATKPEPQRVKARKIWWRSGGSDFMTLYGFQSLRCHLTLRKKRYYPEKPQAPRLRFRGSLQPPTAPL